jgi:hypothetical protein
VVAIKLLTRRRQRPPPHCSMSPYTEQALIQLMTSFVLCTPDISTGFYWLLDYEPCYIDAKRPEDIANRSNGLRVRSHSRSGRFSSGTHSAECRIGPRTSLDIVQKISVVSTGNLIQVLRKLRLWHSHSCE